MRLSGATLAFGNFITLQGLVLKNNKSNTLENIMFKLFYTIKILTLFLTLRSAGYKWDAIPRDPVTGRREWRNNKASSCPRGFKVLISNLDFD